MNNKYGIKQHFIDSIKTFNMNYDQYFDYMNFDKKYYGDEGTIYAYSQRNMVLFSYLAALPILALTIFSFVLFIMG